MKSGDGQDEGEVGGGVHDSFVCVRLSTHPGSVSDQNFIAELLVKHD